MTVGFYTVFRRDPIHYALADVLVRSVRAAMPGVEVVQFTDERSPEVLGVDRALRRPHGPMLERRMEFYAACEGEWLLLDTDCFVQRDVRHVFDDDMGGFDVAIADRNWSLVKDHYKWSREMPFNTGVVFQRHPDFYRAALESWRAFPAEKRANWWSEQWAVADVALGPRHKEFVVRVLPGMTYNRPPHTRDEDVSDAAVLHYKGPARKLWMTARAPAALAVAR